METVTIGFLKRSVEFGMRRILMMSVDIATVADCSIQMTD